MFVYSDRYSLSIITAVILCVLWLVLWLAQYDKLDAVSDPVSHVDPPCTISLDAAKQLPEHCTDGAPSDIFVEKETGVGKCLASDVTTSHAASPDRGDVSASPTAALSSQCSPTHTISEPPEVSPAPSAHTSIASQFRVVFTDVGAVATIFSAFVSILCASALFTNYCTSYILRHVSACLVAISRLSPSASVCSTLADRSAQP